MTAKIQYDWDLTCHRHDGTLAKRDLLVKATREEVRDRGTLGKLLRDKCLLSKGARVLAYASSPNGAVKVTLSSGYHSIELRPRQDPQRAEKRIDKQVAKRLADLDKVKQVVAEFKTLWPEATLNVTQHKGHALIEVTRSEELGLMDMSCDPRLWELCQARVRTISHTNTTTYRVDFT